MNPKLSTPKYLHLGCGSRFKSNCSLVGPGIIGGIPSVGGLSKGFSPVFTRVSGKKGFKRKTVDFFTNQYVFLFLFLYEEMYEMEVHMCAPQI